MVSTYNRTNVKTHTHTHVHKIMYENTRDSCGTIQYPIHIQIKLIHYNLTKILVKNVFKHKRGLQCQGRSTGNRQEI